MPAPTDLTWAQFGQALGEIFGTPITNATMTITPEGKNQVIFEVGDLAPFREFFNNPNVGVIKASARVLAGGRIAQERLNENKPAGERLTAFPAPTTGAPAAGQVPLTYSLTARAKLSSATEIIGTTA